MLFHFMFDVLFYQTSSLSTHMYSTYVYLLDVIPIYNYTLTLCIHAHNWVRIYIYTHVHLQFFTFTHLCVYLYMCVCLRLLSSSEFFLAPLC